MIDPERRLRVNTDEVAGEVVESETIVINFGTGMYYSMDNAGAVAWQLIEGGHSLAEMASIISERYGIESGDVLRDLENIVNALLEERLVVIDEEATSPAPVTLPLIEKGEKYSGLSLHTYTDMSEILALDPPLPVLKDPWEEPDREAVASGTGRAKHPGQS